MVFISRDGAHCLSDKSFNLNFLLQAIECSLFPEPQTNLRVEPRWAFNDLIMDQVLKASFKNKVRVKVTYVGQGHSSRKIVTVLLIVLIGVILEGFQWLVMICFPSVQQSNWGLSAWLWYPLMTH